MYRFTYDYSEAAHPAILQAIAETSCEGNFGYGCDEHTARAAALVREVCAAPDALVQFLVGGTQTNLLAAAAFLRPHEAIIAAQSGHVCVHETGAIEATGHKCVAMPAAAGGKLTPELVRAAVEAHTDEHMVKPRLVYVSNTTETGGVYTAAELRALRSVCDELGLLLYLDGARLASALACGGASMEELGEVCDAFYIGGTKNGALFGEAVCILNPALKPDFRYILKQRGGMLAKGWLLGIQFEQLMQNCLYEELGEHSTRLAQQLSAGLAALGVEFLFDSPSNQIFPILPDEVLAKLEGAFHWEVTAVPAPDRTCVRLVCSWATEQAAVTAFLLAVEGAMKDCPACL